jgi:purine-binding chemotaxis protein CheW
MYLGVEVHRVQEVIRAQRMTRIPGAPNVVVRTSDGPVSLLVNEIGDVIVVDQEQFEAPPETLQGFHRELITGSYKLQGRLMLVLNLDAAVRLAA